MTNMQFYRYEAVNYGETFPDIKLELKIYILKKETPQGYWIEIPHWRLWKKWISKTSKRRYAYPTKKEALTNYIKRTNLRLQILKSQIDLCEYGLIEAKKLTDD